jgi:hypothetical protein
MRNYDLSKVFSRPEIAARRRKNGYRVTITDGEGDGAKIVEQYFVTPEEIAAADVLRDEWRRENLV